MRRPDPDPCDDGKQASRRDRARPLLGRLAFHLAEASNWPSIERKGLLSAGRRLDGRGIRGAERQRRLHEERLAHADLASCGVSIRDQRPLSAAALAKRLAGMTAAQLPPGVRSAASARASWRALFTKRRKGVLHR
jgi:hypothetical protein